MPTLYVENVPEDLYEAIRSRARTNRSSISAEVIAVLAETLPTGAELARRKAVLRRAAMLRSKPPLSAGPFPSSEELQRGDRAR